MQQDVFILRVSWQGAIPFFNVSYKSHGGASQLRFPQRKFTCCEDGKLDDAEEPK